MTIPCFADCVHARDGDCLLHVVGSDRLSEVECACEFYRSKQTAGEETGNQFL